MIGVGVFRPCPAHLGGGTASLACTCAEGHANGHVFVGTGGGMDAERGEG